jgi:hypothetical protein
MERGEAIGAMTDSLSGLTAIERKRIGEFLQVLRTPCEVFRATDSFFNSSAFEESFRSKLLTHHCFIGSPLFQQSFESAFVSACRESGTTVEAAPDGQRFWDVAIAGRKISLKSTKARDLRPNLLHISKLTEAAWIQDCRSLGKRQQETKALFAAYTNQVDAIIQLRYFARQQLYELVEIPVALFEQVQDVGRQHFASDGPSIKIPIGADPPDFTLKLDRSDAKITIANINKARCTVHGTWKL